MVLSEFGWDPSPSANQVTAGTTSGWGLPLRQYLDARPQIGWLGWIFDKLLGAGDVRQELEPAVR